MVVIFILKMMAFRHLGFFNLKIILADGIKMADMHHLAKFRRKR